MFTICVDKHIKLLAVYNKQLYVFSVLAEDQVVPPREGHDGRGGLLWASRCQGPGKACQPLHGNYMLDSCSVFVFQLVFLVNPRGREYNK